MLIHTILRIALVSVCFVWGSSLHAQTGNEDYASTVNVVPEFYNNPNVIHSGTGVMGAANIQVDPHSGMLNISHTDVHIPGNGGMDLTLTRFYHSLSPETFNYYSPVGVGWSLHFGMIKTTHPSAMCDPVYNYHIADNPVYVAPDGSQRVLALGVGAGSGTTGQFVDQEYFTYITQEFDVVFCKNFLDPDPSNDEIWMRKPDGMLYEFGARVLDTNYDSPAVWYVNKIVDPNGNYIEIFYQSSGVLGNSGRLIDYIETSDGRYVDFGYELENSIRARLSYIEYEDKRWDYVYEDSEVAHDGWPQEDYFRSSNLLKVTSPDGDEWRYSYYDFVDGNSGGEGSIHTITNPYGGITDVSYDVKTAYVVNDTDIIQQRVVTSLNEQGRESKSYTYEKTSDGDTTIVTSSAGETTYYFDGLKSISSGTLWRTGLLKKKVFNPFDGQALTTDYEYERKPISSENYIRHVRSGFLFPEDDYYYLPVIKKIVMAMDREEWSQVYDYTGLDFSDDRWILLSPPIGAWRDEAGPAGERTRGYFYEALPNHYSWLLKRGSDGTKTGENTAIFDVFREYDENGNVIKVTEEGKDTSLSVDPHGNLLSATTEEGVSTSYLQYLRGSPQKVVMPSGLVVDQGIDEFGRVERRSFEGRNESTKYDVAGRIQNVSPILGPDTNIEWSQNGAVLSQGNLTHTYNFDAFGRVVSETISAPDIETVQISKNYDPRDNLVSVTVNGSTITYGYDGYDRIVTVNDNGATRQYSYTPDAIFFNNELGALTTQYIRSYKDPFSYELMGFSQEEGVTVDVDRNEFGRITRIASGGRERTYNYGARYFKPISYYESESGETKFYYNSDEQLTRKRMFGNQSSSSALRDEIYSYDASGRLASIEVSSILGQYERTDYVYNELGEIVSVLKQDLGDGVETTYSYELDGNLSSKTLKLDGKSFTTSYQYDQQRRPSQITYPSGNTYSLNANTLGLLTAYEGFVTDAQYHYSGEPDSITFSNGDVYDSALNDRRVVSSVKVQGASPLLDQTYSYDDAFNFVSIEDSINPTRSMSADYDGVSRLIYASGNGNNYGYAYDDLNNIISVSNNSEYDLYSYDEENHLKSVDVDIESQFSYNVFGEVVGFSALGAGVASPGDFLLRRSPDGTVSRIETQIPSSFEGDAAYAVKDFRYDHRGYLVGSVKAGYEENDDLIFGPSQNYMVYDAQGRLIYEFNDRTKLKKEYHYLAGRLIGVVSDERTCNDDPDGDGMPFCFEQENGLDNYANDAADDPDQDGLSNLEEYNASSDPHVADTDADGLPDAWEVAHGLDPRTNDADVDTDGDGLSNYEEYLGEYDPTTPTVPDALAHVKSIATEDGLHISWDKATTPVATLYVGVSPGTLTFHSDLSAGQALVPYDDIPNEGYLALASTSNAGEAPLSPLVSFSASSDWAGFEQGGLEDFWLFLDQQGLGFAVDSEAGSLRAYSSGVMVDSVDLDWGGDAEAEYNWREFEIAVLPNGDVVVAWITEDFANDVFAAVYCLSEASFCAHTKIDDGVESDTFSQLSLEVIGERIVLSWFEEESYPPRDRSRLVIADHQLNMSNVDHIDDFLPHDADVVDLKIIPIDAKSFQIIRGVCCDDNGGFEIYANNWQDSDGLQEEAIIYTYDGPGASGAVLSQVHGASNSPIVLIRPDNTLDFYAISYDGSGWLPLSGILSADDQSITVFDWKAVASGDDIYIAVNESSRLRLLHGVVSGPNNSWSGSEIVLDDGYDTYIQSVDLRSASDGDAAVLASDHSYSRFIRLNAGAVTASSFPPVSGGNAHFISPRQWPPYLSVATTDKTVSRASVRRYQGEEAPADDLSLLSFSEVGYNATGELEPGNEGFICPQWSLPGVLSTFSLAQISGPSFQQLSTEGPCYVGIVPYVLDPQIAVFDVTADMEGVPYDGQDDVVVPAFSPHVTVNGPASLIEGQSGDLSVSVHYSPDGDYYSRPISVSWSQLSGPARPVALSASNGSDAVLWGPNVQGNQISVYSAEVYFPEADHTVTGVYEVEILDTGGVVDLPPQLDLDIQPYSQWGYDMQKVTISSDLSADLTLRMYGSWSMLQDGNEPIAIPAGDEPETGFSWQYMGPFSAILQPGQEIEGTVRAEATGTGLVSYLSFIVVPPAAGPIDPEVTVSGPETIPDGSTASFEAITSANESGAPYDGPVQYTWTQIAGPSLDITGSESSNPLEITLPEVTGSHSATVQVSAYLPDEGMTVTAQKTFSIVDDESSDGQAPEITWSVEPYSAYGYDLNRVTLDAGDATVHMKIYGSWTMLSDGNQPTEVPSGSEPEPNYQYEYVAPFSILREPDKEMDITIRAQSPTSGLISYDRVIVDQNGGTAAPVN